MKELTSSISDFEKLRSEGYLYVDKTEFIWKMINPAGGSFFLSRPRRFGKSLTLSTLKAIFEGKKELFQGLAIYDKPYDWKPYPIIHLSFGDYDPKKDTADLINEYLLYKVQSIAKDFNISLTEDSLGASSALGKLIDRLFEQGQVVILVDEYDKPILDNITNPNITEIQKCLKGFYSVLKDRNAKERFLFVTGVSKFCHVSLFSDLNNLTDISMDARFATMFGYTQEEFEANFSDRIEATAGERTIDEYLAEIKKWYNGYRFEENSKTVYNPVSLSKFFENGGKFNNYWFSTGTPSFLMELTKKHNFDFRAALKNKLPQICLNTFEVDNMDPLTLLFQTGYLTIKDSSTFLGQTMYQMGFPNYEVEWAFSSYILNSYSGKFQGASTQFLFEIVGALQENDLNKLHKVMEVFFAGIPYDVHQKRESTFQAIFFALFRLLGQCIEAESTTNNGRIDAVIQTENDIYLFEFKLDNDPTALEQIKAKEYFKKYLLDKRSIHIVGVNFDAQHGNLVGWQTEDL